MGLQSPNFNSIYQTKQLSSPVLQSVLMIIVIVVFGWFVLQPKYDSISAQKQEYEAIKSQQTTLEDDQEQLNKLIRQLENSEDEIKLLDEAVPLDTRATEIAVLLESYSRSAGLLVTQLNVEGLNKFVSAGDKELLKNPYGANRELVTATTQLVISGNIEQFKNFLQLLETSGRLADVENLEVSDSPEGTVFRVRVKTYAFLESGVADTAEGVAK